MNVYAESSAVLAWLLGEEIGVEVRDILAGAEYLLSSDLTLIECDRVLIRAVGLGETTGAAAAYRRARLLAAAGRWHVQRLGVDRARQPFPEEPIRTFDALHLASALFARSVVPELEMLSLDNRIRCAGRQLGFSVQPREVV